MAEPVVYQLNAVYKTCSSLRLFINRELRRASCGYIPRSSWATPSGPGRPRRARPGCAWPRRRRSPPRGLRRTPRSSAAVCRSPERSREGRASRR